MPKFSRFLKLYWTDLPTGTGRVIADPVRIEVFQGPRTYQVFQRAGPPVVRAGVDHTIATQQRMEVAGERTYIEFIARTDDSRQREYCEDQIQRVVTQLSALLSPALFSQEVWSGWLSDSDHLLGGFWSMTAPPVTFEPAEVEKQLLAFRDAVAKDAEVDQRFTLMSKLFVRAVAIPPGEERFLWLWTVLEVPMQDTNIQPISDHLSQITGHSVEEVKKKLDIGRLFGARSRLVHDGKLPYGRDEMGSVLKKLEAIVVTVLRSLGGLPYDGRLQEYFS
jgi:hypothetical protein